MRLNQIWYVMLTFVCLNVNDSYNQNMNSVGLSDELRNVYQFDHRMHKYKWHWYLLFWGYGLVLFNMKIIYKTLFEEGKFLNAKLLQ